ncbi:hypothetical protein NOC27_837 [Nitrosococcus oceani AFC27]|nr:hypothetical protein NOC27_837 [Nitrosococcus oceani AFC27]
MRNLQQARLQIPLTPFQQTGEMYCLLGDTLKSTATESKTFTNIIKT